MKLTLGSLLPLRMPGSSQTHTIRIRLISLTGLIWLFTIVMTTANAYLFVSQAEAQSWRGRQGESVRNGAANVAAFYRRAESALNLVSALADFQLADPSLIQGLMHDHTELSELLLLDSDGHVLLTQYQDKPVLSDSFTIIQSQWFQEARRGRRYRSDLHVSYTHTPYMVMAAPSASGKVVVVRLDMDVLRQVVADIRFGQTGQAYVADNQGRVIAHTDPTVVLDNANIVDRPEFSVAKIMPSGQWFGEYTNIQGEEVVGASAVVPGTDWVMVMEVGQAEARAISRGSVVWLAALMTALAFCAALVHGQIMSRMVFQPIEQLRASANRYGWGDLSHVVAITEKNEIGIVAAALNDMARRLREQRSAIERRNAELETLRQLSLSLTSNLDLTLVLDAVLDAAFRLTTCIREVQVYLQTDDHLRFAASRREDGARNYRSVNSQAATLAQRSVEAGRLVHEPIEALPGQSSEHETAPGAFVAMPLKTSTRVVGALVLAFRQPQLPGESELRVLSLMSEQVSMALDNARLYQQAQEELSARARAEARYRAIVQDQTELICRYTTDGVLTFVNDAYCRYFNRTRESLIGTSFMPFIVEEDIPLVESKIGSLDAAHTTVTYQHRVILPDGQIRWQHWTDRAIVDDRGEIIEFQSVGRDVTQQRAAESALQASEERLRRITDNMLDVISQIDLEGRVLYASPSHEWVLGLDPSQVVGSMIYERLHADDLPQAMVLMAQAVTGTENFEPFTLRYRHADGRYVWMECVANIIRDAHGVPQGAVLASRDVTARLQIEEALRQSREQLELRVAERTAELRAANDLLRESEERYALAVRGANDGLWDWDLRNQRMFYSARWKMMIGYSGSEISDDPEEWFSRVHPSDLERLRAQIEAHLQGSTPHFENEHRVRHKDGQYRWMLSRGLAVWDANRTAYRMAGSLTDITARKTAEEQLINGALQDALTGLPNRLLLLDRLDQALHRVKRHPDRLSAVLFIDLDRFKLINDSMGHMKGDQLLIAVGRKLSSAVGEGDTVARLGGDEFAVLMESLDGVDGFTRVADRLQEELRTLAMGEDVGIPVSASIGIAVITPSYEQPEDVLRDADTAMYRAKSSGRSRYQVFDEDMHRSVVAQMKLESELRQAIGHDLRVFYQPIVSASDNRLVGLEALVRWQHRHRGLIGPDEFIRVAEDSGLILPIGEWVLRTACAQFRRWLDQGCEGLVLCVNLSARQFHDENLPLLVRAVLAETGLPPAALKLELTESAVMEKARHSAQAMRELDAMGVELVLDDFGIGYSSMGQLRSFPVRMIKIDRSFISDLPRDSESEAIVRAAIAMAHGLKLKIVAEGVENEAQLSILRTCHIDAVQGYLFSRPVPADKISALLEGNHTLTIHPNGHRAATSAPLPLVEPGR